MITKWDYTELADAYLKRPDYSKDAISQILSLTQVKENDNVCDVGAGVAHLTLHFANYGLIVSAVEPNNAMRLNGIKRTKEYSKVRWSEATGENTKEASNSFDLVSFGSSFNVTDRAKTLIEVNRILKTKGWFTCMWNHRDLSDPIQKTIESIIASNIDDYDYGTRREDQVDVINKSGLFLNPIVIEGQVIHTQKITDVIEAWKSHATLERQAKGSFHKIITEIEDYLNSLSQDSIEVPYTTKAWVAQKNS